MVTKRSQVRERLLTDVEAAVCVEQLSLIPVIAACVGPDLWSRALVLQLCLGQRSFELGREVIVLH